MIKMLLSKIFIILSLFLLLLVGCTDNPLGSGTKSNSTFDDNYHPGIDPAANKIEISQGQNQVGTVGTVLPTLLTVVAKNTNDSPVNGTTINWEIISGGGSLSASTSKTDSNGIATISYTLGTVVGSAVIRARIQSTQYYVDFNANSEHGTVSSLSLSAIPSSSTVGSNFSITVTAKDLYNNTVLNYPGTVTVTSSDSQAVLPLASVLTSGTTNFTINLRTAGNQTVTFGDGSLSVTTGNILVNSTTPNSLVLSTVPSSSNAGSNFSITVTAKDIYNNTVLNYPGTVTVTSSDGQAVLPSSSTLTSGTKSFTINLRTAGNQTVTFGDGSLSVTTGNILVNQGVAQIAMTQGNNQSEYRGTQLPIDLKVVVKDVYNNIISGATVDWAVASGGGSLSGTTVATNGSGVVQATWTLGVTPGTQTVTATIHGTSTLVTFTATATTVALSSNTWNFNSANVLDFILSDANKLELTTNSCQLKKISFEDNQTTEFSNTTSMTGLMWDANRKTIRLGSGNSCDGTVTNCVGELDASWIPQAESLVSYWKMNNSGNDSKGSNNGTVAGSAAFSSTSKMGSAALDVASNNTSGFLSVTDNSSLQPDKLSVGLWVKGSAQGGYKYIWRKATSTTSSFAIYTGSVSTLCFFIVYNSSDNYILSPCVSSVSSIWDDQWHYVVGTYDKVKVRLYVDAVEVGTGTNSTASIYYGTAGALSIGSAGSSFPSSYFFKGQLDDVGLWNKALTLDEIKLIYDNQKTKYSGSILSRVYESELNPSIWKALSWIPTLPFSKNLTATNEIKDHYSSLVKLDGTTGDSDLATDLVGLWHLDNNWNDAKVSNHGTANGNPSFTSSSKLGTHAGLFDGNGDFINLGTNATLNINNNFTISAWVNIPTLAGSPAYGVVSWGQDTAGKRRSILIWNGGSGSSHRLYFSGYFAPANLVGTSDLSDDKWHHLVVTLSSSNEAKVYVDGRMENAGSVTLAPYSFSGSYIGATPLGDGDQEYFSGSIDEVAIWSRVLHENEVMQLYRRGANRIKYQVRSCGSANCTDDPNGGNWKGPDGTKNTYYSELQNTSSYDKINNIPTGTVNISLPEFNFTNFTSPQPANNRYVQYKAIFESDDTSTKCNYGASNTFCSPELKSVSLKSDNYYNSAPHAITKTGIQYYNLSSALETLSSNGCSSGVVYNLGYGNTYDVATWYYYTGGNWTTAGSDATTANTIAEFNDNSAIALTQFSNFPGRSKKVFLKAFLRSSGSTTCELNSFKLDGEK